MLRHTRVGVPVALLALLLLNESFVFDFFKLDHFE